MFTHALGVVASIVALCWMIVVAGSDPWRLTGGAIFGGSLVFLYVSSTLYHAFSGPRTKALLQLLDHAAIYLLIAGSYTPLTLVTLRGPWGWSLLGAVWFLAIAGILVKTCMRSRRDHWLSTALYLFMGWLVVVAIGPVVRSLPLPGLLLILLGGVSYSAGVAFFAWERLKYNHAIWHLFVLAGSACHALAVILFILPRAQ